MSRVVFDGKYQVHWASTVSDTSAPTTNEIDAGTDLTSFCPKDFLTVGKNQGRVDGGDITTVFGAESMGTWRIQPNVTMFLDDTTNTAFDLFSQGTQGYMIILPYATDSSPATGDEAYVMELESGTPTPTSPAENERQKFELDFAAISEPDFKATVA